MKAKTLFLSIVAIITINIAAQKPDASKPVLSSSDVESFIANYKNIEEDFKALEVEYKLESGVESSMNELKNIEEINTVLKKYGYSDFSDFTVKAWIIAASYASIRIDSEGSPEIQLAIKQIEEDPNMTKEQKELAVKQMKQALEGVQKAFNTSINEKDIETVRPYVSKLDAVLDTEE